MVHYKGGSRPSDKGGGEERAANIQTLREGGGGGGGAANIQTLR